MRIRPSNAERQRSTGNAQGFTLVEVVVASFLLAITAAALYVLINSLIRMTILTEKMATATTLAQSKIDELRDMNYANVAGGTDAVDVFNRTWTVTSNATLRTKSVAVTVDWTHIDGRQLESSLNSMIASPL